MIDFPRSLIEFQHGFPDECACAAYLADARWPDGFRCPDCDHDKGWELSTQAFTRECAGCGKQTSVTAGTVMHGSKLPLTVWFWAAYLMATHSNGIAALQLQKQRGSARTSRPGCCAPSCARPWWRPTARRWPASWRSTRP